MLCCETNHCLNKLTLKKREGRRGTIRRRKRNKRKRAAFDVLQLKRRQLATRLKSLALDVQPSAPQRQLLPPATPGAWENWKFPKLPFLTLLFLLRKETSTFSFFLLSLGVQMQMSWLANGQCLIPSTCTAAQAVCVERCLFWTCLVLIAKLSSCWGSLGSLVPFRQ